MEDNTNSSDTAEVVSEVKVNNRTVRFSDAPWYKAGIKVIVGGVGGIGSWLSMALSRQDSELYLFDFDEIDETNMGGQMFQTSHINRNKAEVMKEQINSFSANSKVTTFGRYNEESFSHLLVFSAFDSMSARKLMFDKWVEYINSDEGKGKPALYLDGRLLAESIKVFAVTRNNIDRYREYLWDDSEIEDVPCSFKATTHCSMMIAGLMVSVYNNYLTNVRYKSNIREVPFLTEFELPILSFNKE